MKVLIEDGFSIDKGTGVGRYTHNLANELAKCPEVDVLPQPARGLLQGIRPLSARRVAYGVWLETGFQKQIKSLGADLVHFTNYLVPRARKTSARYAVTIHDLTVWKVPQALPFIYGRYIRSTISRAVNVADLILCDSYAIRKEIIQLFDVDEQKVRTAWVAYSPLPEVPSPIRQELSASIREKLGLQKPFILFVGTLERRKNVATLVEAFARVAQAADLQLVMVGRPGYGFSEIEASIKRQSCRERYILTGYVSDKELSLLYTLADLFAYPSLYEGFGIPLVEAMSFGLPIVASRIPASEEVAGDSALYYDDPLDSTALAAKILEAMSSRTLQSELGLRGKQRAAGFSWKHVVQMYTDAYKASLNA
jgi:glycosyltransferase involved in cell wall biosynthesis